MTDRTRRWMILIALMGFAALLVWGVLGLPGFGHYPGPYGDVVDRLAPVERKIPNAISAINFDIRGLDTMGEEYILFTAVAGLGLVLLQLASGDEAKEEHPARPSPPLTDASSMVGRLLTVFSLLFGLYILLHAHLSPGGGFQGGTLLASSVLMIYLFFGYKLFRRLVITPLTEPAEAFGMGAYVVIGFLGAFLAGSFLANFLPLGSYGDFASTGSILLLNAAVGMAVTAGFLVALDEILHQLTKRGE